MSSMAVSIQNPNEKIKKKRRIKIKNLKKSSKQKPDKYSDGPRQTKMKKSRGGGGSKGWGDMDDLDYWAPKRSCDTN